jgi:hypothetical protein
MPRFAHALGWRHRGVADLLDAGHILIPALAGVFGLIALSFVVFLLWPRSLAPLVAADAPSLPITIADTVFNVPPAALRVPQQRRPGAQERIDLVFLWPSLQPPDPSAKPMLADEPVDQDRLFVSIATNSGIAAPADLITSIYPRYLENAPRDGPDGLAALAFRTDTPYAGEDLFYDPTAPERFFVRCSRATATPGICLLDRRIGGADITVRFPRDWLAERQHLAQEIDRLIAGLRPATN